MPPPDWTPSSAASRRRLMRDLERDAVLTPRPRPVQSGDLEAAVPRAKDSGPASPRARDSGPASSRAMDSEAAGLASTGAEADPDAIEILPEYEQVRSLLESGAPLVFVTGGAGTGKSTLIRYLRRELEMGFAVVAPTGVAALQAEGVTMHSLFRLPPKVIQPGDVREVYDRSLYCALELLIVDEVSMVRPDLLDGVDLFLRINRQDGRPFGGVQVLLIGDLFQLPPVAPEGERLVLRHMGYASDYFFSARGIAEMELAPVILDRVFRQRDPAFVQLLNNLREGRDLEETLAALNARCAGESTGEGWGGKGGTEAGMETTSPELILTCTNASADARNRRELSKLEGAAWTFMGSFQGEFRMEKTRLPAPMRLALKPGAQVMFTKNDMNKRWVNGTIGRVLGFKDKSIQVEIVQEELVLVVEVKRVTWRQYRYEYRPVARRVEAVVAGKYRQFPLTPAWAVTIHKAQGKTLDRVLIDLGHGAFAPGQVYVALSRVRALEDLRLARAIEEEEVQLDPVVVRFYGEISIRAAG